LLAAPTQNPSSPLRRGAVLLDDANVPSLLLLPYLGVCAADDALYVDLRKPRRFRRCWVSWADMLYVELVLASVGIRLPVR
jgi:meiotically up-regulated gene 157 (Mug157) protein